MKRSLFIIALILFFSSCSEPTARRPKEQSTTNFYNELIEKNKQLNLIENKKIAYFLAKDTVNTYQTSSTGFWFTYVKKDTLNTVTPKLNDVVTIEYNITDLNDVILYQNQKKEYKVDKEDFIPALQDGIKLMKSGETITFVIPSYRAFGVSGDGNKINGNQTIKSTLTLLNIKNKINESK